MSDLIILDEPQGSDAWLAARREIPTGSAISNILTPKFALSSSRLGYMGDLLAEYIEGDTGEGFKSEWMERGNEIEPMARAMYAAMTGNEVEEVGMVYQSEDRDRSCSPDGLTLNRSKGLEMKAPKLKNHIKYVLEGKLPSVYAVQVYSCMNICNIDSWDFMSFHPNFRPLLLTIERDWDIDRKIQKALDEFCEKLADEKAKIDASREF